MLACNWAVIRLWADVWPRWKMLVGMGGAARQAMDLVQLESALRLRGVKKRYWPEIMNGLMAMETEALEAMAETS